MNGQKFSALNVQGVLIHLLKVSCAVSHCLCRNVGGLVFSVECCLDAEEMSLAVSLPAPRAPQRSYLSPVTVSAWLLALAPGQRCLHRCRDFLSPVVISHLGCKHAEACTDHLHQRAGLLSDRGVVSLHKAPYPHNDKLGLQILCSTRSSETK